MSVKKDIFDYSEYVEVVAREADATAYPYFPSDQDFQRSAPRLLSRFKEVSTIIPPSMGLYVLDRFGENELHELVTMRVDLFNSMDPSKNSLQGSLTDWLGSKCYICGAHTVRVKDEVNGPHSAPHVKARACPRCGWWESENTVFLETELGSLSYDSYTLFRRAYLRDFAIFDNNAPLEALRVHLVRHPKDLNRISPRKLERLVGSIFSDFFSCETVHVGGPRDGGFDLLLLMSDTPALVQVKQRMDPKKSEAVSSIREFLGAMVLKGGRIGFFVSTARRFSPLAQEAANKAKTVVEKIELVDASKLIDMLKIVAPLSEPWRLHAHRLEDDVQSFEGYKKFKFITF
jgi:hypothetical protein